MRIQASAWPTSPRSSQPVSRPAPAHSAAPEAAASVKRATGMRDSPATGAATAEKPGTNLATSSAGAPQRPKRCSVCVTQLPGFSDSRHSSASTL